MPPILDEFATAVTGMATATIANIGPWDLLDGAGKWPSPVFGGAVGR